MQTSLTQMDELKEMLIQARSPGLEPSASITQQLHLFKTELENSLNDFEAGYAAEEE